MEISGLQAQVDDTKRKLAEVPEKLAAARIVCNTPFTPSNAKLVNEMSHAFKNISTKFPCKFFLFKTLT